MGYQIYKVGPRWGGYGVPAICEHPECNEEIDRGVSFACGGEPFSEEGCDKYFCSKHLYYTYIDKCEDDEEKGKKCEHEEDCECIMIQVCQRCKDGEESFDYKPETKEWVDYLLTHESWEEWRKNNPDEVAKLSE